MAFRLINDRRGRFFRVALALVALSVLAVPVAPAGAHSDDSHNFESVPQGIAPAELGSGIEIEMLDQDARLQLRNGSGKEVIVMGYEGEAYAKITADGGVFLNTLSPAYFLNQDRYATTPVGPEADPSAPPKWVKQSDDGTLTWFDKRSHSLSEAQPAQVEDSGEMQQVREYSIPLSIDDQPAKLNGTLYWSGEDEFPMATFAGLLLITGMCTGLGVIAIEALRRAGPENH